MSFIFDERDSDSPFVETIWRATSEHAGAFTSVAVSRWEMVVMKHNGAMTFTVRGPETKATSATFPADAEWCGIQFKLGVFMPHLPSRNLVDGSVNLPEATGKFWLRGATWQYPYFENADTFVNRLVQDGLLVRDNVVSAVLQDRAPNLSVRSVRRHFLQATGLTPGDIRQIERARQAAELLQRGVPILDAVYELGYFDQPHMTRSLKRLLGQTPAQLARVTS